MAGSFHQVASSSLSLPPDSYIYSICPLSRPPGTASASASASAPSFSPSASLSPGRSIRNGGTVSVITSDNSLRLVRVTPNSLSLQAAVPNVHGRSAGAGDDGGSGVTAQCRVEDDPDADSNLVATTGRDGVVKFWDVRAIGGGGKGAPVLQMQNPKNTPLSALTCSSTHSLVAAGTELPDRGPGDAPIFLWDVRNPTSLYAQYSDSHTDTVTSLTFRTPHSSGSGSGSGSGQNLPKPLLLSGSTDSLVNLFDTARPDEEDALLQVFNHGSAIHQAGFLADDVVFALGTDETLSFYNSVPSAGELDPDQKDPDPVRLGDLRPHLSGCDYVVKVGGSFGAKRTGSGPSSSSSSSSSQLLLGLGSFSDRWLDLVPLSHIGNPQSAPLNWAINPESRVRIPGAHGEELVRDLYAELDGDCSSPLVLTCGEDSHLRLWTLLSQDTTKPGKQKKAKDGKEKEKDRFKPY